VTFVDRVAAQRALEEVAHHPQIEVTKSFAAAVPETLLETKVRT
jgi:hypothetical protein